MPAVVQGADGYTRSENDGQWERQPELKEGGDVQDVTLPTREFDVIQAATTFFF